MYSVIPFGPVRMLPKVDEVVVPTVAPPAAGAEGFGLTEGAPPAAEHAAAIHVATRKMAIERLGGI